jgi:predicted 2-oxoglutarate/Fe(II)-dependent dioxygenase YbiX
MKEVAPGIVIIDNLFINEFLNTSYFDGLNGWSINKPSDDKFARNADAFILDTTTKEKELLKNIFQDRTFNYIKEYLFKYKTTALKYETPVLLRYGVGQKFSDHIDDHPLLQRRRISIIYYINDTYLGGEIEFPRFNIKIKPNAQSMIIFPSSYTYNHTVHEIVDGKRYCIVQWAS